MAQARSIALPLHRFARLLWNRRTLAARDHWSRKQLLEHQAVSLTDLRAHVYANSPFYRRFHEGQFDCPLAELPVLTKEVPMANWNDVVADRSLRIDEVRTFIEGLDVPQLVGPQAGYDERTIAEALVARLVEQGAHAPTVSVRIVDRLMQSATGKTRLVRALPLGLR